VNEFSKERVPGGNFRGYPIDNSVATRVYGSSAQDISRGQGYLSLCVFDVQLTNWGKMKVFMLITL